MTLNNFRQATQIDKELTDLQYCMYDLSVIHACEWNANQIEKY